MTEQPQNDYSTSEATAEATRELCKGNPKAFASALAENPELFASIVMHHRQNALWLDGLLEELRESGLTYEARRQFRSTVGEQAREPGRQERSAQGRRPLRTIGADEAPPLLRDALGNDAPVPEEACIPAGYQVSRTSIQFQGADGLTDVASRVIVISGDLVDQASGMHRLLLSWWDGGKWRTRVVDRAVALNRSKLPQEANYGFPVDSENASAIVRYLAGYEATNGIITPRLTTTSHLGWQELDAEGSASFLCGAKVLRPGEDVETTNAGETNILEPDTWHAGALRFHAKSEGDTQIADAFEPVGTFEQWQQAIRPVAGYPVPLLALYASLAAPVLSIVKAQPFIVDICGNTSQGKTTTLQIAASPWGNPDPTADSTLIGSWNNTGNYVGEVARMMNGLPILLDDTSVGNPKQIPQLVYQLASGRGRGRMLKDGGTQEVGSWETITLSTGEDELTSFSQDGGTRARVLSFWGPPFGSSTNGAVVTKLRADLKSTYGHAGPRFVQYLLDHQDTWSHWRQSYRDFVNECVEDIQKQNGSGLANRLAEHAAVIRLTAVLAHELNLLPWSYQDPINEDLWAALLHGAREADRATEALRLVHAWAAEHKAQFDGYFPRDSAGIERVPSSVLGDWKDDRIVFSQNPLRKFLEEQNFRPDGILRTWGARDWLEHGQDNGTKTLTKAARLHGKVTRCFVVPTSAFVLAGAVDADEVDYRNGLLDEA